MTTQHNYKMALLVAIGTAAYLALAILILVLDIGLPFSAIFFPAILMMIVPVPLLTIFGLADHHWLLSFPTTAGFVFLILVYATVAYFLTLYIAMARRTHNELS